jgi:4-hydroxythreonine-4-phosphate dehydrogenase
MGEPAGIGPEIAVAAYKALGGRVGARTLRIVGDPALFDGVGDVLPTLARATRNPGKPDPRNASAVTEAIDIAVHACLSGEAAAIVTAPINKDVLHRSGFAFPGHTEFLGALTGAKHAVMMLASDQLRVVPLTIHVPLADVPRMITTASIVETAEIVLSDLARDFRITKPRLAIAGLNPHPGEFGKEDLQIIAPAVEQLKARGHDVRGPLPADDQDAVVLGRCERDPGPSHRSHLARSRNGVRHRGYGQGRSTQHDCRDQDGCGHRRCQTRLTRCRRCAT